MRRSRGDQGFQTPLENHKNYGFLSSPVYKASIRCHAIIGPLAKRHLMAFGWWADDGPLLGLYGTSALFLRLPIYWYALNF